jgi:hypothetical protein
MKFEADQAWRQRDGRVIKIKNIGNSVNYPLRMSDGTGRDKFGNYWDPYREDYRDLVELVYSSDVVDELDTTESLKKNIKIREIKLNDLDEFTTYIENNRDVFKIKDDMSNFNLVSINKSNDVLNGNYYIITFSIIE